MEPSLLQDIILSLVFPVRRGSSFGLPDSVVALSSFWKSGSKTMEGMIIDNGGDGFCHRVAVISTRLGLYVFVMVVRSRSVIDSQGPNSHFIWH